MKGKWLKAGDVLDSFLEAKGLKEGVRRHTALLGWDEAVGSRIAERARPIELRGKTLFVDVDGSAWMHELAFLKEDILRKLNEKAPGGEAIDQIVFMAGGGSRWGGTPARGRERRNG
ncbi:MAG: DUF721 domain-containing protein [Candidatus Eisenbacteria bacterium]